MNWLGISLLLALLAFRDLFRIASRVGSNPIGWGIAGAATFLASAYFFYFTCTTVLRLLRSDYVSDNAAGFQLIVGVSALVCGWLAKRRMAQTLERRVLAQEIAATESTIATSRQVATSMPADSIADSAIATLRPLGYTASYADGKYAITDPDGKITRYFSSSSDLAGQMRFLVERVDQPGGATG